MFTNSSYVVVVIQEPDNQFAHESILEIIRNLDKIPEKYRTNLKNNGGGFVYFLLLYQLIWLFIECLHWRDSIYV